MRSFFKFCIFEFFTKKEIEEYNKTCMHITINMQHEKYSGQPFKLLIRFTTLQIRGRMCGSCSLRKAIEIVHLQKKCLFWPKQAGI